MEQKTGDEQEEEEGAGGATPVERGGFANYGIAGALTIATC